MRAVTLGFLITTAALIALSVVSSCGGDGDKTRRQRTRVASFHVPSASMEPTYKQGEVLKIDVKPARRPGVGDVIAFFPPAGATANRCGVASKSGEMCRLPTRKRLKLMFLQRVVAKGGDLVSMRNGRTIIDGRVQVEPYIRPCAKDCDYLRPTRVPSGYLFMLGDNRGASDDSRFWGPIPKGWVIGRVIGE